MSRQASLIALTSDEQTTLEAWVRAAKTAQPILAVLDPPPPSGHATWTGTLVARALGEVSAPQVWRVLRRYRIHLQRRRSWCVSTGPEFAAKAADIVGLYLAPPGDAAVA